MVIWRWFTYLVSNYLQQIHLPLFMRPFFIFHTFAPDSRRRPSALARLTVRFSASPSRRSRPSWQSRPMAVNTTEMETRTRRISKPIGTFSYTKQMSAAWPSHVSCCKALQSIIPRHTPSFFVRQLLTSLLFSRSWCGPPTKVWWWLWLHPRLANE